MKNVAMGVALVLTLVSWAAVAEDQDAAKSSTEQQCQSMGEQHGVTAEKMDAWMKKCMEMSEKMNDGMDSGEKSDMNNSDNMQDPQDGDKGMGGDK
jgi:hypothetical protein